MKGMNGIAGRTPVFHYAERNPKFQQEKVCCETDLYLVHFDGVLLDHARPTRDGERFQLLISLYEQYGSAMTAHLKGQYNLVIWDKQRCKVLVTNDLLSKRSLYYVLRSQQLFYASSFRDLADLLHSSGCTAQINVKAVQAMAAGGSLGEKQTYLEDVFYLDAFESLTFDLTDGTLCVETIAPKTLPSVSGMDEAIQTFDQLFTEAVRCQFAKNEAYGYRHYVALSGGMDSRACLLKAVQCGCAQGAYCFNYSPFGSIDHTVSQQIAFDNDLDYLHYPMDAAVFINRLEDATACNECQQSCIGSTGARTMARLLDTTESGIVHVGLCGGELMGDLVTPSAPAGKLHRVMERLGLASAADRNCRFGTREYLNNLRACQNFSHMFLSDCEVVSPFMDEDVVQFVLSLDPALLYRRTLYREWMKKHIPNQYTTTMFCGPITISPFRELLNKLADRIIRRVTGSSKRDMNPFDAWLAARPHLMQRCTQTYEDGMSWLKEQPLPDDCLTPIREAWQKQGESRFFALTAIMALKDLVSRLNQ